MSSAPQGVLSARRRLFSTPASTFSALLISFLVVVYQIYPQHDNWSLNGDKCDCEIMPKISSKRITMSVTDFEAMDGSACGLCSHHICFWRIRGSRRFYLVSPPPTLFVLNANNNNSRLYPLAWWCWLVVDCLSLWASVILSGCVSWKHVLYAFVVLLANPHVIGGSLKAGTESADRMEEKVGVHEKNIRPTGDTEYWWKNMEMSPGESWRMCPRNHKVTHT